MASDPACHEKGIPEHLHRVDRPIDDEFLPEELLYRRFVFGTETLIAAIQFNRMSVNRGKHGHGPDDALWKSLQDREDRG